MKKEIKLILLAAMLATHTYSKAENKLLRGQHVIMGLQANNENFHPVNLFNSPEQRTVEGIGTYTHYLIDKNELQKAFNANYQSIRLALPQSDGTIINLLLTQHQILTDDFKLTITDERGKHEIQYTPGLYYYGMIEGYNKRSMVACSIFDNELACVISDESGNWNLGPLKATENASQIKDNEYAYYNDKTFQLPLKFTCNAEEDATNETSKVYNQDSSASSVNQCIKIFFDCANDLYVQAGNNATSVSRYVASLFNVQATLYFNENITVSIQSIHVWTVPDNFDYTTFDTAWQTFKDYYLAHGYTGDIAQLLSNQTNGGTAFLSSACAPPSIGVFSFCGAINLSFNSFPTYSWDAEVSTHENGHVLGSNHTQWCGWPGGAIDNCYATEGGCAPGPAPTNGGTIMSYCHLASYGINFANGFGPLPGNAIRNYVAAQTCFTTCPCPSVTSLSFPIGAGNNLQYNASGIVYGYNTISNGATVVYSGGNSVSLRPGFNAQQGSVFTAEIASCPPIANPIAMKFAGDINSNGGYNFLSVYPNPSNDKFNFHYQLVNDKRVKIAVYNSEMQLMKVIIEGAQPAGEHHEVFDASGYAPGIYFAKFETGADVKTTKLVVIKN